MKIDFYVEFPTKKNLEKLKLITWPCKIFIAAHSLNEFQKFEKQAKKINKNIKTAYWPIVKNSYWISPLSNTKDLKDLFSELEKCKNELLIDLEFPILNKKLFFKNFLFFLKNKRLIKEFLEKNKKRITTAQFPSAIINWLYRLLGIDYSVNSEKSFMWYSSTLSHVMNRKTQKHLLKLEDKHVHSVGLGTIAKGIITTEPILSPDKLRIDLNFVKKNGFKKVIIFRLGGLNKKYIETIKKFL
jgi:hypothetical protein